MKKVLLSSIGFLGICAVVTAQDVNTAIKLLNYERISSAKQELTKLVAANPKDVQAVYWLGQAYIMENQLDSAKMTYQNALNAGANDPLIWVGSGEVEELQGGDINSAKQKFEQAITATTATRGKHKGEPDVNILIAIGRAMAAGNSKQGDVNYGIDKLKQAAQISENKDANVYINLGLCYRKLGGDQGGPAFEAYRTATTIDPQNARPYYLIGRIFESQRNKESMDEWYNKAINADPAFAPVYLAYFNYYAEKDVTTAKAYLDKYVANADKDCNTDFFLGDYLLRAGKYQESMQQANQMAAGACANFPGLNLLYAYDYDRTGDSVKARSYIMKYFQVAPPDIIQPRDYAFAGTVLAKFPESGDSAIAYLQKAIILDTIKEEQQDFLNKAATIAAASGNYKVILDIMRAGEKLNGGKLSASDYFNLSKKVADAASEDKSSFDTVKYLLGDSIILSYINAFPEQPQGYQFETRYAKAADRDTSRGLALVPLARYNEYLVKDTATESKKAMFANYYYLLIYYAQYASDLSKEQEYQKAVDVTNKMKEIYPDPNSEEYQFADKTGKQIQSTLDKFNNSKNGGGSKGTGKTQK